eukprot:gene10347-biopygen9330
MTAAGGSKRAAASLGSQDSGAGVARAWRGRGAGYRQYFGLGGAGVARAWRGRGAGMSCDPWVQDGTPCWPRAAAARAEAGQSEPLQHGSNWRQQEVTMATASLARRGAALCCPALPSGGEPHNPVRPPHSYHR